MREHYAGLAFSAIVHFLIVAAFFIIPVEKYGKPKNILIDFTIERGSGIGGTGDRAVAAKNGDGKSREEKISAMRTVGVREAIAGTVTKKSGTQPTEADEKENVTGHRSDPQGQVIVHGNIGAAGTATGTDGSGSSEKGIPGTGGGRYGRTLDYGHGGQAERSFAFIRENIMRNITYPERARRMGWEGKVLLSFVVSESGAIEGLKIINSSGFRALDENAREAVLKTRFSQRIPYRMAVLLPVEYRLE